jgi:hypothetical protein
MINKSLAVSAVTNHHTSSDNVEMAYQRHRLAWRFAGNSGLKKINLLEN